MKNMTQEIWYQVEYSPKDADDWCKHDNKYYDSIHRAEMAMDIIRSKATMLPWQFRVIKITHIEEVVS